MVRIFVICHIESITLDAGEEIYEVSVRGSNMGLDGISGVGDGLGDIRQVLHSGF